MEPKKKPILLFVVNADWFFVSHRLRLAEECRRRGYDVHVCAGASDAKEKIETAGFPFHPLPIDRGGTNPLRDFRTLLTLYRLYRRLRPDLVHHVTIKPVLYGGLLTRWLGIPAVQAVSGLGYVFIENEGDSRGKAVLRAILKLAYRFVFRAKRARVLFQNPSDRDEFIRWGLVPAEAVDLIPGSGVSLSKFRREPLPEGPPVVLLPARLLKDKGVGEFVEAARILRKKWPSVRWVLAGRVDPGNPAAIELSEVRGWVSEGLVEWWDGLGPDEMPKAYAQATLVVLPSYREGLPLVLAEAAAVGRPTITTNVPGCRDAVTPGVTGWVVPVRDSANLAAALEEALGDPAELSRRADASAKLAVERFAEESIFSQIIALYARLGVPGS